MESTCWDGRTVNGNTLSFLYFATGKYMIERLILFHMPQSTFSEDAVPGQVGNQLDQFQAPGGPFARWRFLVLYTR